MGTLMQQYAPTPTDYSNPDNWAAFLDRSMDADTFYLYPTMGHANRNDPFCEASDMVMRYNVTAIIPTQILPWIWDTNLYAPFYRQASFAGITKFMKSDERTGQVHGHSIMEDFLREEEMDDIYAALDYFFENLNKGKPFFLVSHSQGSALMKIVLEDYRAKHPERFERMIAAYCPGWTFTPEWCEKVGLAPCTGPEDTGVLISWNCEWPSEPDVFSVFSMPGALCINPVNWTSSEKPTPYEESLGSLVLDAEKTVELERSILVAFSFEQGDIESEDEVNTPWIKSFTHDEKRLKELFEMAEEEFRDYEWGKPENMAELWDIVYTREKAEFEVPFTIRPGYVSAWVNRARGTLSVEYPEEHSFTPRALGEKTLHMLDYPLFFEDIRNNVGVRIEAWKQAHKD